MGQAPTTANLAMVAEPQSLDPMASTADLVGLIMQHVYEPLFTFDAKWAVQPMLAAEMPKMSADGKTYTIELRKGVKLHNGRDLDAEDVVASLKRWVEMTPRGKALGKSIASITAKGPVHGRDRPVGGAARIAGASRPPLRFRRHHGEGIDRQSAGRFRRNRPLQVPRAQARSVRGSGEARRLHAAQRSAQRLCRQARGQDRRIALHPRSQRQHARRGRRRGAIPVRRPASRGEQQEGVGCIGRSRRF